MKMMARAVAVIALLAASGNAAAQDGAAILSCSYTTGPKAGTTVLYSISSDAFQAWDESRGIFSGPACAHRNEYSGGSLIQNCSIEPYELRYEQYYHEPLLGPDGWERRVIVDRRSGAISDWQAPSGGALLENITPSTGQCSAAQAPARDPTRF
jgi:hypothetical protein